ncbi:MAG: copper amine oxidase N-terminal domain-containing protein [Defluviitaleaceae bacterium]|nr:copper amine oxidase N-terminal domain-containing protein [Defluviitaleaceae bacterium]
MKKLLVTTGVVSLASVALLANVAINEVSADDLYDYDYEAAIELGNGENIYTEAYEDEFSFLTQSNFISHTGEVLSYDEYQITLDTARISIDEYTFILGEIEVGANITFYTRPDMPVGQSYPPFFGSVAAIVVESEELLNHKVDMFLDSEVEGRLISQDGSLLIQIGENTQIVDASGNAYEGNISGRNLLVTFGISTRSIPEQATPNKIVVLPVEGVFIVGGLMPTIDPINGVEYPSIEIETGEGYQNVVTLPIAIDGFEDERDFSAYPIILNNSIGLTENFIEQEGNIFVPFRVVVEALGFNVNWNAQTAQISLNQYGEEGYAVFTVSEAGGIIVENRTYVPLSFFRDYLNFNNAYFHGGHVQINNEEVMQ